MRARARIARGPALMLGAAVGLELLIYPYAFGLENHAIQIPLIHQYHDPGLYPGDAFMSTREGYVTFFWPAVAWLTTWLPLQPTFFVGHVLTLALRYAAVMAIAASLSPRERWAPYLAIWLNLWWQPIVGGESLHWFYWAHTPVATALGLWAVVLVLRARPVAGFALGGIVAHIHLLQGVYLVWMFAIGLLTEARRLTGPVLTGSLVWLLLALPILFVLVSGEAVPAPPDLPELLRIFFPVHFFPSSFPMRQWVALAAIVGLFAVAAAGTRDNGAARRAAYLVGAALLLMCVGTIAELAPLAVLLKLHVFRISTYVVAITLCLVSGWMIALGRQWVPEWSRPVIAPTALLVLAIPLQSHVWAARQLVVAAGVLVSVCLFLSLRHRGRIRRAPALCAVIALTVLVGSLHAARLRERRHYLQQMEEWFDVQRWAHVHTARDARFLTPPYMAGFRVFSARPVVAEWIDGAAVMWDPHYARYWRGWYEALGGRLESDVRTHFTVRLETTWRVLSKEEIGRLARHYGAAYIVVSRGHPVADAWQDVEFRNAGYLVVRAPAGRDAEPASSTDGPPVGTEIRPGLGGLE